MKSRITIEIDYSNGNEPVIQILRRKSDDVRDGMIQSFIQALGHASVWCRIECVGTHMPNHHFDDIAEQRWYLRPIKPEGLAVESKEMHNLATAHESVSPNITAAVKQTFGDHVGEDQYKEMVYQRQIQNPYPTGSQSYTAFEKGFELCYYTFSKAEKPPYLT